MVVRGPDNAATELISAGENGLIASSASPRDLAAAIVEIHAAGLTLRESTVAWFRRNAARLSLASSVKTVVAAYRYIAVDASG